MTKLLSITAHPDAPVACDMTGAEDTLADRIAEYRRLFDHALLGRESTDTATTFRFAARPGVREWVLDLVRREAACCPFLSYEVDLEAGRRPEIVWTTSGGSAPPRWRSSTSSCSVRAARGGLRNHRAPARGARRGSGHRAVAFRRLEQRQLPGTGSGPRV